MSISDLASRFRSRFLTYTPVVHLLEDPDGAPMNQKGFGNAALVTLGLPGAIDQRLMRFDAVVDMPVDITSAANVAADRIELDTFASTARQIQAIWHGSGLTGMDTQATAQFFGEVALGALISVNAADDTAANARLTYTDLTGAGASSAGKADTFMVSGRSPIFELMLDEVITRIDVIGIPNGLSTTHLDVILPCFLELRIIG